MLLQITFMITRHSDVVASDVSKWQVFYFTAEFNLFQSDCAGNDIFDLL
jgi:hypothetical protein